MGGFFLVGRVFARRSACPGSRLRSRIARQPGAARPCSRRSFEQRTGREIYDGHEPYPELWIKLMLGASTPICMQYGHRRSQDEALRRIGALYRMRIGHPQQATR